MDNLDLLESILNSDDVVRNFYNEYNKNQNFNRWIVELLPEIETSRKQEQNNPWHLYDVLTHILHSVQNINILSRDFSESDRRMLQYVMLFHDLGKPACHKVEIKDGKVRDRFKGHDKVSEEIANRSLKNFGFNDNEISVMSKLIGKHDMFIKIKFEGFDAPSRVLLTDELLHKEVEELNQFGDGLKLMKYLNLIGKADSLAQNLKVNAYKIELHDKIAKMLEDY